MRNIGEELKAKMVEQNPEALKVMIYHACQLLYVDDSYKSLITPPLASLGFECVQKTVRIWKGLKQIQVCTAMSPEVKTLDNILCVCQILLRLDFESCKTQAMECINYLNAQSQLFHWMDEYAIEDGNIIVKPKHNKELREGVANLQNNELDNIVRMFYRADATVTDKEAANASLYKLLEVGDTRKLLMADLDEKQVGLLFEFANTQYIRHGKLEQRKATPAELQIFFDFGLALVRFADQINKNKNLLDK